MPGALKVGLNYAFYNYGWDFGVPPGSTRAEWKKDIDTELEKFQKWGIDVVRWFLLGDGWNYGSGSKAPKANAKPGGQFEPVSIGKEFLDDFCDLLRAFQKASRAKPIQLIPSLVDHRFCLPRQEVKETPGWVKAGRADVFLQAEKRDKFLAYTLVPLVGVSTSFRDVIYAWEVMNEPEEVTALGGAATDEKHPVDEKTMQAFLRAAVRIINDPAFKMESTIGYKDWSTLQSGSWGTLGVTRPQFHYYPEDHNDPKPELQQNPAANYILGEFATSLLNRGQPSVWPGQPQSGGGTMDIYDRLCWIQSKGYRLALPWSYRHQQPKDDPRRSRRPNCSPLWAEETENLIELFNTGHLRSDPKRTRSCT